ncbi:serine/threonine protein kinase [Chondromyces crocatus]|uniref:non-specific serine/threonine protein kinase n=1 Tax=Chondromyces crocatus TaxID=52 RepID=A0A0K1EDH2_CHOCO|nr:serine/threonine-protein kinase [Chondromyces crocatus]AKT38737.1 protein kinase [Chondromyces crocatus]
MSDDRQREGTGSSTSPKGAALSDPLIGRVINDRFKIVSVIARGGMGKVYRAEQAPLGRICALKVLSPKYDGDRDPEFHRRFVLEAATASKLTHPNTVTVFDYGQSDDIYYIAMEYIEGRTMHRALREEGPFDEQRTSYIARQICRSLREAHGLGVVHRDLKPGNVLLVTHEDEQDHVKVLDFGLVKDVESGQDLTQQGLFMGSPKYMAPEQITGGEISARTDVYALGVMMYEMLTGQVPFDRGASVSTLMAHVHDAVPPMHEVYPGLAISPAMEGLIYRCLDKNPRARFASMNDVLIALKRTGGATLTDTNDVLPAVAGNYSRSSRPSLATSGEHSTASVNYGANYTGNYSGTYSGAHSGPHSAPPTNPIAYPGLLSPDASSQPPPGAPVFVPPPITDSLGPRPRPPSGAPAAAPSGMRRLLPWAVGGVLASVIGVGVVLSSGSKPTTGADQASTGAPSVATTAAPAPTPSVAPQAPTSLAVSHDKPASLTIDVESNPPGAVVLEGAKELCAATPCRITWHGDDASPAVKHELTFEKRGFKPTKVSVIGAEDRVKVKLEAAPAGRLPPPKPEGYKDNPFGN